MTRPDVTAGLALGDAVRTSSVLARETIYPKCHSREDIRRVWRSVPTTSREGVLVGIRHLQNGRIIAERESDGWGAGYTTKTWACDEVVKAALVSYGLYLTPELVAFEEVEPGRAGARQESAARPECQHLARGDGGTWCGDPDAEFGGIGLALRPRVPVCAVCHMKAMHYRADRQAWAEGRLEAVLRAAQTGTPTNPHAWAEGYAEAMARILDTLEAVVWDTPDTLGGTQTVGGLDNRAIGRVVRLSRHVAYGPLTGIRHGKETTVLEWATGHDVWDTQGAGVPSSTPCVVEDAEGSATP